MRKMLVSNLEAMRLDKKATFVKDVNYIHICSSKRNTDEQFFIETFSLITYKVAQ